jgi:hypothetical protein
MLTLSSTTWPPAMKVFVPPAPTTCLPSGQPVMTDLFDELLALWASNAWCPVTAADAPPKGDPSRIPQRSSPSTGMEREEAMRRCCRRRRGRASWGHHELFSRAAAAAT